MPSTPPETNTSTSPQHPPDIYLSLLILMPSNTATAEDEVPDLAVGTTSCIPVISTPKRTSISSSLSEVNLKADVSDSKAISADGKGEIEELEYRQNGVVDSLEMRRRAVWIRDGGKWVVEGIT